MKNKKQIFYWSLYDFGNSAFATTIIAGFFPLFFKKYWSHGVDPSTSTFYLGLTNSIAGFILAFISPFLGALADKAHNKRKFLLVFTLLGVFFSANLAFISQGQWHWAALSFAFASIGFAGSNLFYDAFLTDITSPKNYDKVSGIGYSIGYLGGGLLFVINAAMVSSPATFGIPSTELAVKLSFFSVAVWWLVFSLPLIFKVKEKPAEFDITQVKTNPYKQLVKTFQKILNKKKLLYFLIAYLFYIDGVNTLIKMAVDYGLSIGLKDTDLIKALIIVQFVAFPSAFIMGWIGEKIGSIKGIYICITGYVAIVLWGFQMQHTWEFMVLATMIGLFQGGLQLLSRSYFAKNIPKDHSAEFFGFYNMCGKFTAIFGPVLVGTTSQLTGDPRMSILVILIFFILGFFFLLKANTKKTKLV